ncbi:DUF4355 domain-containing protein [Streptococcus pasteurianus]|jgi:hypothetical protein|uniref:DUF4355 domain-containing protein n=1 Tax=Streptococcus pasteurianus TaxID=197614 RepID=UPI0022E32115|nr:DUF4355 domain-containing protein [Streptococcus pasteurianus]
MEKELLALNMRNLQFFADGADGGTDDNGAASGADNGDNGANNGADDNNQAFKGPQSQSELDSLTNKAVQKALENYKKGEQERIEQRIAEALEKEKDYANLSAAERAKREFEDSKSAFEQEKAQFEHEKLVVQVEKDLVSKGLPAEFAELLAVGDAEQALKQVSKFEKAFNDAVNAKVKVSLRQPAPNAGGNGASQTNYGASLAKNSIKTGEKLF